MIRGQAFILLLLLNVACAASAPAVRPSAVARPPTAPHNTLVEWESYPTPKRPEGPRGWQPEPRAPGEALGDRIAAWASSLDGTKSLTEINAPFRDDCVGFVRLVFAQAGIALIGPEARPFDNGVTAIFRRAVARRAYHMDTPRVGDLVFFRETYDRNRDKKRNDGLTHIGIVTAVDANGTVSFMHHVNRGVRSAVMNPRFPTSRRDNAGRPLNDYLRKATRKQPARLTGELFAGYASLERMADESFPPLLAALP